MQLLLDFKIEYSSCKMREGSDIIFHDRVGIIVVNTTWKLGSSWSCKPIYVIYMCGTEGRGTRSHHRVCWPYHISKHMAHSIQRRMLENMTEITMLVFIASVQAAVQLRMTNAASMKAQLLTLVVWNGRKSRDANSGKFSRPTTTLTDKIIIIN